MVDLINADRPCYDRPDSWDLDCIGSDYEAAHTAVFRCAVECPFFRSCNVAARTRAAKGCPPKGVIEGGIVWSQKGIPLNANVRQGLNMSVSGVKNAAARAARAPQPSPVVDLQAKAS